MSKWNFVSSAALFCGVVFLLASLVFDQYQQPVVPLFARTETWATLFRELGFALLIAFVITEGIERAQRNEFTRSVQTRINQIQKSVLNAIYRRRLPDEVITEVETQVFESEFLRRHLLINYTLSALPGSSRSPDHLLAAVECSYEIENVTASRRQYDFRCTIEVPPEDSLRSHTDLVAFEIISDGTPVAIPIADIKKREALRSLTCTYSIYVDAGKKLFVRYRTKTVKRSADVELWQSFVLSLDMSLAVEHPQNLLVAAGPIHPAKPELVRRGDTVTHWRINRPILPHQGIVFFWFPKEAEVKRDDSDT